MKTKPFNFDEMKPDFSNVRFRDQDYTILEVIKINHDVMYPIIVVYSYNRESIKTQWVYKDGRTWEDRDSSSDLVLIEEPKLIVWSKLPVDTLIGVGGQDLRYLSKVSRGGGYIKVFGNGATSITQAGSINYVITTDEAKLVENPTFTFWQGGDCPVPEGVAVEIITSNRTVLEGEGIGYEWNVRKTDPGNDIIAYRILGPVEGYSPFFMGKEF